MINNARRVKTPGNVLMAKSPCLVATPVCCVLPYRGNRKQVGRPTLETGDSLTTGKPDWISTG